MPRQTPIFKPKLSEKLSGSDSESINLAFPGVLIGKNLSISKKCFLDIYAGIKYKFINQKARFFQNQGEIIEESKFDKVGIRLGLNFGYRLDFMNEI